MKRTIIWLLGILMVIAAGTALYVWRDSQLPTTTPMEATSNAPQAVTPEPTFHYPVPESKQASEVPPLDASDQTVWDALAKLVGSKALRDLFYSERIVRNIVVTIDNLPRQTAASRLFPIKPAPGAFRTEKTNGDMTIATQNAARYAPYVRLAEAVDTHTLVEIYQHYYPLFQNAYRELGYPDSYFNDRLVAVIDHLLAAPDVDEPVELVQPHVTYKFADPDLEKSSIGHKIMIRMGSSNAERVKRKLSEIRSELAKNRVPG